MRKNRTANTDPKEMLGTKILDKVGEGYTNLPNFHFGQVIDSEDPDGINRLKVRVPLIDDIFYKDASGVLQDTIQSKDLDLPWCVPANNRFVHTPENGSIVLVAFFSIDKPYNGRVWISAIDELQGPDDTPAESGPTPETTAETTEPTTIVGALDYPFATTYLLTQKMDYNSGGAHKGIDIGVAVGTPVLACYTGIVQAAWWQDANDHTVGGGLMVIADSKIAGVTYRISYMHLSSVDSSVVYGKEITKGQQIGLSGNTGYSSGPHLHLQVHTEGPPKKYYDPVSLISSMTAPPVPEPTANGNTSTLASTGELDMFASTRLNEELATKPWQNAENSVGIAWDSTPEVKRKALISKAKVTNYKVGIRGKNDNKLLFDKEKTILNHGEAKIEFTENILVMAKEIEILSSQSLVKQKPVFADPLFTFLSQVLIFLAQIVTLLSTVPGTVMIGVIPYPVTPNPAAGALAATLQTLTATLEQLKTTGCSQHIKIN